MIGETLGNYRVVNELGQGGMGVVYIAEHLLLGKQAVVKVLRPEYSANPDLVNRFFNEARAASVIKHAGIVDIYDFGHHDSGSAYIVMEFLDGENLADRMYRAPLPEALIIEIARQVGGALSAAHAKGIVHRDLKPDNIFLVPDETIPLGVRVKVLDFGIAKLADDVALVKTRTGTVMGTPAYMAPEQCRGVAVDSRADIYALACIVYESIAGQPPFLGEGSGDIMSAHIHVPPKSLAARAKVSPAIGDAVMHALAKAPSARPQTMTEFVAELEGRRSWVTDSSPTLQSALPDPSEPSDPSELSTGPALHPPTTLDGAVGERAPTRPGAARWSLPVIGLGLAAVVVLLLVRRAPSATPPFPSVATPQPILVEHLPEARVATVTLRVTSTPSGADVYRLVDGVHVGKTPYQQIIGQGPGDIAYRIKLANYDPADITLPTIRDGAREVVLERHRHSASTAPGKSPITDDKVAQPASAATMATAPAAPAPAPVTKPKQTIINPFGP